MYGADDVRGGSDVDETRYESLSVAAEASLLQQRAVLHDARPVQHESLPDRSRACTGAGTDADRPRSKETLVKFRKDPEILNINETLCDVSNRQMLPGGRSIDGGPPELLAAGVGPTCDDRHGRLERERMRHFDDDRGFYQDKYDLCNIDVPVDEGTLHVTSDKLEKSTPAVPCRHTQHSSELLRTSTPRRRESRHSTSWLLNETGSLTSNREVNDLNACGDAESVASLSSTSSFTTSSTIGPVCTDGFDATDALFRYSLIFDGADFDVFKQMFNRISTVAGWSTEEKLRRLVQGLRGPAEGILLLLEDKVLSFDLLMNTLESCYGAKRCYQDVLDNLEKTIRRDGESLHDFAVRVVRVLSFAHVSSRARKQLARYYFVQGLTEKVQQKYIDNRDTRRNDLDFALYLATRWEKKHVRPDDVEGKKLENSDVSKKPVPRQSEVNQGDKTTVVDPVLSKDDCLKATEIENKILRAKLNDLHAYIDTVTDSNFQRQQRERELRLQALQRQQIRPEVLRREAIVYNRDEMQSRRKRKLDELSVKRFQRSTMTTREAATSTGTFQEQEPAEIQAVKQADVETTSDKRRKKLKDQWTQTAMRKKERTVIQVKKQPAQDDGVIKMSKTISSNNTKCAWLTFDDDIRVLCTISKTAPVSVLPREIYDLLSADSKQPCETSANNSIRLADVDLTCFGVAKVMFQLDGENLEVDMHIVDDAVQPILGEDFLAAVKQTDDTRTINSITINGQETKLFDYGEVRVHHKVSINKQITLSSGCEAIVQAKVQGDTSLEGRTVLIEPARTLFVKTGALVCKTVAVPRQGMVYVRIFNPDDEPIIIFKNTTLGILQDVDQTRKWKEPTVSETDTDGKIDSSTNNDNNIAAEIRNFSNLPTTETGDVDYDRVPQHLQDLYDKSVQALNSTQKKLVHKLFNDYEDVFARDSSDIGRARGMTHHIDTGDEQPVHQRPRRHAKVHADDLQKQVKNLADAGIIRPSESEWASNVVMARKKDGTWRMCVDYRELNLKTKNKGSYMLPRIDDTLDALNRAKFFCSLDVIQGYHHIELTEQSKPKTAFYAPKCNPSHWEYNFMPFGLVGAPRTFQRMMDRLILGLEYKIALAYLDDIIVYGASIEECVENLRVVFDRVRKAGLKLKPSKCSLFQRETNYLGHIISAEGVKTDPKKVEAVRNFAPPRNTKDVQTFMGMVQYYSKFIKNFMGIAGPLLHLMSKKNKFEWTSAQQQAFETLKTKLTEAPVLAYPVDDARYILDTDASNSTMGAVLSQLQADDEGNLVERVIAYASKKFNDAEKFYCARRRELLAIVRHVKYFDAYLRGQNFIIRTDHASLRYIKTIKELPAQFHRWVMTMEEYTYEIQVRKGNLHANADAMSRLPCGKTCICEGVADLEQTRGLQDSAEEHAVINALKFLPRYTPEEMADAQASDPDLKLLYQAKVINNVRPPWNDISGSSPASKAYFAEWLRLEVRDKILYRRWENNDGSVERLQMIVPFKFQRELCSKYHDTTNMSHLGKRRCYAALMKYYYWYKMHDDIRWWIKTCEVCQRRKRPYPTPKAPMRIYVTGQPNERLSMDVVGPMTKSKAGNMYLLCMTDHFTKFAKAVPVPDQGAETLMDVFMREWCDQFGPPKEVHTDQGAAFEGRLTKELTKLLNIEKTRTVAFKPSSNALVERYNQTIVQMVSKLSQTDVENWDKIVVKAVQAYNGSVHSRTGFTPNKLWFGREQYHNPDLMMPTRPEMLPETHEDYVRRLDDEMRKAYQLARETIGRNMKIQKRYYDRNSHLIKYKEGDAVWLKDFSPKIRGEKKLADRWSGPHFVVDVLSDVNFRIIDSPDDPGRVVGHDRMKRYEPREPFDIKWVLAKSKSLKRKQLVDATAGTSSVPCGVGDGAAIDPGASGTDAPVVLPDEETAKRLRPPRRGPGRPKKCREELAPKRKNPLPKKRRGQQLKKKKGDLQEDKQLAEDLEKIRIRSGRHMGPRNLRPL